MPALVCLSSYLIAGELVGAKEREGEGEGGRGGRGGREGGGREGEGGEEGERGGERAIGV